MSEAIRCAISMQSAELAVSELVGVKRPRRCSITPSWTRESNMMSHMVLIEDLSFYREVPGVLLLSEA